jgi:chemotaxis protein CheD
MGEIAVARETGTLQTLLGSCLGLALYDRRLKLGGLAHIVLPDSQGADSHPGKFADTAIPALVSGLQELAPRERLSLQAKIAGGANMFASADPHGTIGSQNVQAVERILDEQRISIVARHCGGEQGRRMTLDIATGTVTIQVVGAAATTM